MRKIKSQFNSLDNEEILTGVEKEQLANLKNIATDDLLDNRYKKFRNMGRFTS